MSNVKAGDLAIIKCQYPVLNGRIVEVLYVAPNERFVLPNGLLHEQPSVHPAWVLKAIGGPFLALATDGSEMPSWYGVVQDSALRPLPADPESVDEREEAEV